MPLQAWQIVQATIQIMAVKFYGLTKIDLRLSENALWAACVAQWLIVSKSDAVSVAYITVPYLFCFFTYSLYAKVPCFKSL